jgi:hypothetical protein
MSPYGQHTHHLEAANIDDSVENEDSVEDAIDSTEDVIRAASNRDLSAALGCSEDAVETMRSMGYLSTVGELWNLGPARDYLRDAAWADELWR